MKFTKDEKTLISASNDKTIRLWDIVNKKEYWIIHDLHIIRDLAINPINPSIFVSASDGKAIKIWNIDFQ